MTTATVQFATPSSLAFSDGRGSTGSWVEGRVENTAGGSSTVVPMPQLYTFQVPELSHGRHIKSELLLKKYYIVQENPTIKAAHTYLLGKIEYESGAAQGTGSSQASSK